MEQKKLYELAADLADGRPIGEAEQNALRTDPAFAEEQAAQSLVKTVLGRSSLRAEAPPELRRSIITSINASRNHEPVSIGRRIAEMFLNPQPAFAVALVVAIAVVSGVWYLARPGVTTASNEIATTASSDREASIAVPVSSGDIVHQASDNYENVTKGVITVQFASRNVTELDNFFKRNGVAYHVHFAHLPSNIQLVGGVVSEYKGAKIAHLVYKRGSTLIYVYQTGMEALRKKDCLTAKANVIAALVKEKPFMHACSHCNIIIWKEQETVCSAVSKIPGTELLALLTTR